MRKAYSDVFDNFIIYYLIVLFNANINVFILYQAIRLKNIQIIFFQQLRVNAIHKYINNLSQNENSK